MGKEYVTQAAAALRVAILSDAALVAALPGGVCDDPPAGVEFPYVRLGRMEVSPDDTDGAEGALVQIGIEVHSRPGAGRLEVLGLCEKIAALIHRQPDLLLAAGLETVEIEVQTWTASRAADGATFLGVMACQITLDA